MPVNESVDIEQNNDSGVIVVEDFNFEPPAEIDVNSANVVDGEEEANPQIKVLDQSYKEELSEVQLKNHINSEDNNIKTENTVISEENQGLKIPEKGVFLEILKETWIEVKDDAKLYISKVLQKGDTYTVPEGKGMILSLGNYDGANVYINGKLTKVARPNKKTNIALDPLLEENQ